MNFTKDVPIGINPGADPWVVRVGNALRLYWDWGNQFGGTTYNSISPTGAVSP